MPVYWPGGVRHVDDASPVCGFRAEQEKACPDTAGPAWAGDRESPSGRRGDVSTVAGCAGGPARSSAEAPVTGVERRGRVVRGCCLPDQPEVLREESRGRAESIRQAVRDLEAGGLGGVGEGKGEQGSAGG